MAYCSRVHQAVHWRLGHRSACQGEQGSGSATAGAADDAAALAAAQRACTLPEHTVATEEEDLDDEARREVEDLAEEDEEGEEEDGDDEDEDGDAAMADADTVATTTKGGDGADEAVAAVTSPAEDTAAGDGTPSSSVDLASAVNRMDVAARKADPCFLAFQRRVAAYPTQVLRYARIDTATPVPLWVSRTGRPTPADVPPCPWCARPRHFEFQVRPRRGRERDRDRDRVGAAWALPFASRTDRRGPRASSLRARARADHVAAVGPSGRGRP